MMRVNVSPEIVATRFDSHRITLRFEVYMYTHGAQMVGLGVGICWDGGNHPVI